MGRTLIDCTRRVVFRHAGDLCGPALCADNEGAVLLWCDEAIGCGHGSGSPQSTRRVCLASNPRGSVFVPNSRRWNGRLYSGKGLPLVSGANQMTIMPMM